MSNLIQISEIFGPTIQGEGALIGRPTLFVRTAGCDYRCSWCDTLYAVDTEHAPSWRKMDARQIMAEIERLSDHTPMMVTLSGGNPALYDLSDLIDLGHKKGYQFAMETQGSLARDWFSKLDVLTLSPKPPSSGMTTDWDKLKTSVALAGANTNVSLKVVVFDQHDYDYAQSVGALFPHMALYLQAGNPNPAQDEQADIPSLLGKLKWLADKVAQDRWTTACVLPQLHVLAWGNERGV